MQPPAGRPTGKRVADGIVVAAGRAQFVKCDVSVEADVKATLELVERNHGGVEILVNSAGVNLVKPFVEVTLAD